jgi:hypothetical protein
LNSGILIWFIYRQRDFFIFYELIYWFFIFIIRIFKFFYFYIGIWFKFLLIRNWIIILIIIIFFVRNKTKVSIRTLIITCIIIFFTLLLYMNILIQCFVIIFHYSLISFLNILHSEYCLSIFLWLLMINLHLTHSFSHKCLDYIFWIRIWLWHWFFILI